MESRITLVPVKAKPAKWLLWLALSWPVSAAASEALNNAQKAVRMGQFDQAFALYQQAAEEGSVEAQYQLGTLYLQGRGTTKNEQRAVQWLEQATEQDHAAAQYLLALHIEAAQPERAQSLLQASADQGFRAAKTALQQHTPAAKVSQAPVANQWFGAARKGDLDELKRLHEQGQSVKATDTSGRTALYHAVIAGELEAAKWLISQGVDPNHRDKFGLTAAQTAIEAKQPEALKMLLSSGVNPQQTLSNGDTLLHYALRRHRTDMISTLLSQGVALNQRNNEGWTALDLARYQNSENAIRTLLAKGAQSGDSWLQQRQAQDLNAVAEQLADSSRIPPVAMAVINSNAPLFEAIVEREPKAVDTVLDDGTNLLLLAVKHHEPKMVTTLLARGAKVDAPAYRGVTALHEAVRRDYRDILGLLLAAGADPTRKDVNDQDAVMIAIEEGNIEVAQQLLEAIAESGTTAPTDRYLLAATENRLKPVIDQLLPKVAGPGAVDKQNRNALWFAARDGDAKLVEKLLQAGVSAEQMDHLGRTPFMVAVDKSCLDCARLLLPHSDINQQSNTGNTPLMVAAGQGDSLLAAWLVQHKADVELRNQKGNTAIMEAVNANSIDVVRLLINADAKVSRKNKLGFSAVDLAKQVSPQMVEMVKSKSVLGLF